MSLSKSGKWTLLSGDVSGIPAIYARKHGYGSPELYDVYEVNLWEDLDSSAVETYGRYNVQSGHVDVTSDDMPNALRSWGLRVDLKTGDIVNESGDVVAAFEAPHRMLVVVECLWHYGAKDVAADVSGNNLRALVRTAKDAL